jgi:outer membrane protein OmpA-like peptidoglycan-associated protein
MVARLELKPAARSVTTPRRADGTTGGAASGLPRFLRDRAVTVSQPTDASERHADHLAEHVMSSAPCPACAAGGASCGGCGGIARSAAGPAPRAAAAPALGAGQPLDSGTRGFFEPRFGRDLGGVRVHAGEAAGELARSFSARAFTTGHDIVFARGQYAPGSEDGRRLLAHEMAHVVAPAAGETVARQPDAGPGTATADPDAAPAPTTAPQGAGAPVGVPAAPPPSGLDGVYGACPTPAEGARRDAFAGRTFHLDRNIPSTTFGMFDATYFPWATLMPVTVKTKFKFVDADNAPGLWEVWTREAAGEDMSRFFWTDAEEADFKREYISRIIRRWSAHDTMVSTKPCWGFLALPLVSPVEVDDEADAHYVATIHKSPGPAIEHGKSSTSDPKLAHPERPAKAKLYQSAVREEASWNSRAVARSERQRLESALAGSGASPVMFEKDSDALTLGGRLRLLAFAYALRSKNPSDPLIPLNLDGFASMEGDPAHNVGLSDRRAVAVRDFLFRLGVLQPMGVLGHGPVGAPNDPANRKVDITVDHVFETTYAGNRSSVAEHEFGHMLGLPDEYQNNVTGTLGTQQTLYTGLVTAAGVSGPAVWGVRTASQMSDGVDVLPRHYVTMWEALARMTAPDITQAEWQLR